MSYDGIIMQRAIARFDQARQRREAELDQRRREVFACGTSTAPSAPP